ncbi:MAG: SIR2 family NAD-dependent protein deacylase [Actinomycetota bacterium]
MKERTKATVEPAKVATWLRQARRVTALTGAGISTDSGIPDFRGPDGVWTKDPKAERLSHIRHYMDDPEVRVLAWQGRLNHPAWHAQPNPAHRALADLERKGCLHTLVTQNIDGLHQLAGTSEDILIEIHGTIREVQCMECDDRAPMELALDRVRAGEIDPPCRTCGGILKSATVSFGQSLDPFDLERASDEAGRSDLFLALGTSLGVYPVAYLPNRTLENGGRLVIVNAEPTPFDRQAAAVINAPLAEVLPEFVRLI